ncbi:hypothetical protein RvY_15341-2 [Ramazzottius varieornatus]|uniref:Uncharacterized protein n=1 Tax=Ramazzottius varieornatus TaxID=947166 RepID=A0A1D1W2L4_RAMVA|nr:hypothetical protein RvY_15341-2 [Ramazzottius varieornatus]
MSARESNASSSTRSKTGKASKNNSSLMETPSSQIAQPTADLLRRAGQVRNRAGEGARKVMKDAYHSHSSTILETSGTSGDSSKILDSPLGFDLGKRLLEKADAAFNLPPPEIKKEPRSMFKDMKSAKRFVPPVFRGSHENDVLASPMVDEMGLTPGVYARRQVKKVSLGLRTPAPLEPPQPQLQSASRDSEELESPVAKLGAVSATRPLSISSPKTTVSPRHAQISNGYLPSPRPSSGFADRSAKKQREPLSLGLQSPREPRPTTTRLSNISTPVDRLSNAFTGSKRPVIDIISPSAAPYSGIKRPASAGSVGNVSRFSPQIASKPQTSPVANRPSTASTSKRSIAEQADSQPSSGRKSSLYQSALRQSSQKEQLSRGSSASFKTAVSSSPPNMSPYRSVRSSSGQLDTRSIDGGWVDSRFGGSEKRKSDESSEQGSRRTSIRSTAPSRPSISSKPSLPFPASPRGSSSGLKPTARSIIQSATKINPGYLSEDDDMEQPAEASPSALTVNGGSNQRLASSQKSPREAMWSEEDDEVEQPAEEMPRHVSPDHCSRTFVPYESSTASNGNTTSSQKVQSPTRALLSEGDDIGDQSTEEVRRQSISRFPSTQATPNRGPSRPSSNLKPVSQLKPITPRASSTSNASIRDSSVKPAPSASRRASSLQANINSSNTELPIAHIVARTSDVLLEEEADLPRIGKNPSSEQKDAQSGTFSRASSHSNRTFDKPSNSRSSIQNSQSPRLSTMPVIYNNSSSDKSSSRVLSSVKSSWQPSQSPRAFNVTYSGPNPISGSPRRSNSKSNASRLDIPSSRNSNTPQTNNIPPNNNKRNSSEQSSQSPRTSAQTDTFNNPHSGGSKRLSNEVPPSPRASAVTVNFNSPTRRSTFHQTHSQQTQTSLPSSAKKTVLNERSTSTSGQKLSRVSSAVRPVSSGRSWSETQVAPYSRRTSYGGPNGGGKRASSEVTGYQRMSTYLPEHRSPFGLDDEWVDEVEAKEVGTEGEKVAVEESLTDHSNNQENDGENDDNDGSVGSGSDDEDDALEMDGRQESGNASVANVSEDGEMGEAEQEPATPVVTMKATILDDPSVFPPRPDWFANRGVLMELIKKRMAGVSVTGSMEEKFRTVQDITSRAALQVLYPEDAQVAENDRIMSRLARQYSAADFYYFFDKFGLMKNRTCPFEYFVLFKKLFFFPQVLRKLVPTNLPRSADLSEEEV